jgi:hypothetical protein
MNARIGHLLGAGANHQIDSVSGRHRGENRGGL